MEAVTEILIRNRLNTLESHLAYTNKRLEELANDIDEQNKLKLMFESERRTLKGELLAAGKAVEDAQVPS